METRDSFFAEGAWDTPFADGTPAAAPVCMGSGAQLGHDGIIVFSPSHTFERLHCLRRRDELFVSNSLPYVLALSGDAVVAEYGGYAADLTSFTRGMNRHVDRIPTRDGHSVQLAYLTNLRITADLAVYKLTKNRTRPFHDFDGHVGVLEESLTGLHENATSKDRDRTYRPLATVSTGYDSSACAALAKEIGCTEALTFRKARPSFASTDDSGKEIGELLGLCVREFDRDAYLRLSGTPEAEFLASGVGGEEIVFAPLEALLQQRCLITGYNGDALWDKLSHTANDEFWMRFDGGASLGEFRIRVGFIHCCLPMVCYRDARTTVRISNSEEMRGWSTGGSYDRPIPRRILEERGVPRGMFGQEKKAVTQNVANTAKHASIATSATASEFAAFARDLPPAMPLPVRLMYRALGLLYALETRIIWRREARAVAVGRSIVPRRIIPDRYRRLPVKGDFTFHWAMSKLQDRYRSG